MPILLRYILIQIPGALLVAVVLYLLHGWDWISTRTALLILFVWVLKDALLYPLYRPALQDNETDVVAGLEGATGLVRTDLDPQGLVEVSGERWQARSEHGAHIAAGTRVRVLGVQGMVLVVSPAGTVDHG